MLQGCECHGYSSDITRTWPIDGKFTPIQRALYDVVLGVQKDLIKLCSGCPSLDNLFDTMCSLLGKGLQEVGLISKSLSGQALNKVTLQTLIRSLNEHSRLTENTKEIIMTSDMTTMTANMAT